jgi:hypothetical protein
MTTTKNQTTNTSIGISGKFNKITYGCFVLLAIYFLVIKKDIESAMSNLGIALIFDPFDQTISFTKRPVFQRVWLLVHVVIVLSLLGIILFNLI